ncbi:MAG: hypothetical protein ABIM19_02115 [candidate division WOR-3 bacterium]
MPGPAALAIVGVAIIVGIATSVVEAVCEAGTEREENRQRIINRKRKILRRETEYKSRDMMLKYLTKVADEVKDERERYWETIRKLKDTKEQIKSYLIDNPQLPYRMKEELKRALAETQESIDIYYAEMFRIKLFLDEIYRWKKELKSKSLHFKIANKVPQLSLSNFFMGKDFPIRGRIVHARIRKPFRGPEFELDCGIMGRLPDWESRQPRKEYRSGQRVEVYIEMINYREKTAVVSLRKAEIMRIYDERPEVVYLAKVIKVHDKGCKVVVNGVEGFLPISREKYRERPRENEQIKVKIVNFDGVYGEPVVQQVV